MRDKLNPGIYCILNLKNSKRYIGSATRIKERWRSHKNSLRKNKHFSTHLQSAWNKYLEESFEFQVLEYIDASLEKETLLKTLEEREEYWITFYNSINPEKGYNSRPASYSNLGLKWPEEAKKKFSDSKKGIFPEHLKEYVLYMKEHPEVLNKTHEGYWNWRNSISEEEYKEVYKKRTKTLLEKNKIKRELYGKVMSDETIDKIIETGIKNGNYTSVYAYFPDGTFYKKFQTIAQALKFLSLKENNTNSLKQLLNKYYFFGLIWSDKKYDKYPIENISSSKSKTDMIIFNEVKNTFLYCNTIVSAEKILHFNRKHTKKSDLENINFNNFKVFLIAPSISDNSRKACEFIKSLYLDNNEPTVNFKKWRRCND